ncbi:unnamed protein product [Mycena citricolor]|uniref:SH3 domain-containing protein n=1 Tax=Mycena citricolor TaxID=2018698 RepID=A0AAD2Q2K7_9AGAR|nr:unnamed protein product [Mycena citricolor]
MPIPNVFVRDDSSNSNSTSLDPSAIAGIGLAGAIVLALAIWLAIRKYRQSAQKKRDEARLPAFTPVRGVYRENDAEKQDGPQGGFSRDQLTPSVVLPDKVLTRPMRNEEVIDYHRQSGTFPKPFSFALTAGSALPVPDDPRSSWIRHSFASSGGSSNRFSVMSSTSSIDSNPTSGTPRKIRQQFNPVLPDELLVSLGERLTVVQAFDDGWVVVGRSGSVFAGAKSLFKTSAGAPAESDVELGVVPAWCFIKPVKGLRAERPVRSTSLGITVQMENPAFAARNEVLSWSNF